MSLRSWIDTFPAFLEYWSENSNKSIDDQIDAWANQYMSHWPDLLELQQDNYAEDNLEWHQIAREKVFPFLPERLTAMKEAHRNLLEWHETVYNLAQERLLFESDIVVVIYAGIGCGAGWYTPFRDSPALLYGLENIAECNWSSPEAIKGLIAHEIGHLVHHHWREPAKKSIDSNPWWQLYEEGFAQRCESLILDTENWHQAEISQDNDWLDWCRNHLGWLAAKFLRTVKAGESVASFFGSWYEIDGKSETGYFLGHEVIKELETRLSIKDIALLDDIESRIKPVLERMI